MTLKLEKNPDIVGELGRIKEHRILVGFAAETPSDFGIAFSEKNKACISGDAMPSTFSPLILWNSLTYSAVVSVNLSFTVLFVKYPNSYIRSFSRVTAGSFIPAFKVLYLATSSGLIRLIGDGDNVGVGFVVGFGVGFSVGLGVGLTVGEASPSLVKTQ